MKNISKNIRSLDSLDREILKLKLRAKAMEKQLDDNFEYLQDNYPSMVKNSFFKSSSAGQNMGGNLVWSFLSHDRMQEALGRVIDHFSGKVAGWIDLMMDRIVKSGKD